MAKKYVILTFALVLSFTATVNAETFSSSKGAKIDFTITSTTVTNAPNFVFQPSPGVNISVHADDKAFVVATAHDNAFASKGGEAYGMASESSGIYTLDVSASDAAVANITLGDVDPATAFGGDWVAPKE